MHLRLGAPLAPMQLLAQVDGKLLLVGSGSPAAGAARGLLSVVRLDANGGLDRSYGAGGVARTTVLATGDGASASLAADGDLLLAGGSPTNEVVLALTPAGAPDQGFGEAGIATIPGAGSGVAVAALANGSAVTLGETGAAGSRLTRLTPTGAPDSTFARGGPVSLPAGARGAVLLPVPGGAVVVGAPDALLRYTAAGTPDPSFGTGGLTRLPIALPNPFKLFADGAGGGLLIVGPGNINAVIGLRVDVGGLIDIDPFHSSYSPAFGGGASSSLPRPTPQPLPRLVQDSFLATDIAQRSDGSFVAAGGVSLVQPRGEGVAGAILDYAAAAFTPSFGPVAGFGEPATRLRVRVALARQHAATAAVRHGIRVTLNQSAPGLTRVRISAGGHVIAQSVVPVFGPGPRTLPAELTYHGAALLHTHRDVRVSITAQARDLLTGPASAKASGTLR